MVTGYVALLTSALLELFGPPPSSELKEESKPTTVTVQIQGVTTSFQKLDGSAWDGLEVPKQKDVDDLANAIAAFAKDPTAVLAAALTKIIARPSAAALGKPDVQGTARLVTGSKPGRPIALTKIQDSYTPSWAKVQFVRVPLDGTARIQVSLNDSDLTSDDPMGVFEITGADLKSAAESGKVFQVFVADQTNNQILFASISVFND